MYMYSTHFFHDPVPLSAHVYIARTTLTLLLLLWALFHQTVGGGSRVYHTSLCLLDLGVLLLSTLRFWLLALARVDPADLHPALCRLLPFLELTALMAPPWLLFAMLMQLQEGLRKSHAPGANVTRCKALVYSGTALVVAVALNLHRVFLYGSPDEKEQEGVGVDGVGVGVGVGVGDGEESRSLTVRSRPSSLQLTRRNATSGFEANAAVPSGSRNESSHATVRDSWGAEDTTATVCAPTSEAYATFANDVWPWLSLSASLVIPLVAVSTGVAFVFRLLCQRSRRGDSVSPSPSAFAAMTLSALLTGVFCVVTSGPLCVLCLTQARAFWTHYGDLFSDARGQEVEGYFASCLLRLLFYGQFALRWMLTCWCCRLWSTVSRVCRCVQSPGRSSTV